MTTAHGTSEPATMHDRVVAAAADLTTRIGWSQVTMSRIATQAGVSRQTVYNEIGTKQRLAEAMVLRELATFLDSVEADFDRHPDDLIAAVRAASTGVLRLARTNALLQAIVTVSHGGGDHALLPLLTTQSDALIDLAKAVVARRLAAYDLDVTSRRLDAAVDVVVRVVLSHVVHPSGDPEATGDDIAWIADRVLRP